MYIKAKTKYKSMCIGKLLKCISKSQITCFTFPKVNIEHIFRANTSLSYREDDEEGDDSCFGDDVFNSLAGLSI